MRGGSCLVLVLAISLGGCLGGEATAGVAPERVATKAPSTIEFERCPGLGFIMEVPDALMPTPPPGYGEPTVPTNNPHLIVVRCEAILVNGTRYADVPFATVSMLISQAGGQEAQGSVADFYRFEWFLPFAQAPAMAQLLQDLGWAVFDASISVDQASALVQAEAVRYELRGELLLPAQFSEFVDEDRYHYGAGRQIYMDYKGTDSAAGEGAGTLQAEGGFFGAVTGEAGTLGGLFDVHFINGTARFSTGSG